MKFEFDPAKDAVNQAKHGLSLADAARLDWNRILAKPDTRADYGEPRQIGYGPIGRRLTASSLLPAAIHCESSVCEKQNRRETDRYESQIDPTDKS